MLVEGLELGHGFEMRCQVGYAIFEDVVLPAVDFADTFARPTL